MAAATIQFTPVLPEAAVTCDHQLCAVTTHNLQKEAIDAMVRVALKSLRQLLEGLADEAWIKYFERHLALIDFEGFTFDPFDHERLYIMVVNKMLDTPVLYVSGHKKCKTSLQMFILTPRQMIGALNCDTPEELAANSERVQLQARLARVPLSPNAFLDVKNCQFMCDDALESLLTVAAVHNQLLDQIERKMPAFLSSGRAPPQEKSRQKKTQRSGFFSFVEEP